MLSCDISLIQMCSCWLYFAGTNYCMGQIAELCSTNSSLDDVKQIQNVLLFLDKSEGLSKHVDLFMHVLSLVQSKEAQFILTPLLSDELREANFLRYYFFEFSCGSFISFV